MVLVLLVGCLTGCASSEGPSMAVVPAASYHEVFDAAVEAARRSGLKPLTRDRRMGVIETDARYAGSMLEPWRGDNASFDQALENTVSLQRRRARFEFVPAGQESGEALPSEGALDGPAYTGIETAIPDLTMHEGPLELRVWVSVERSYRPDQRRSTWSRRSRSTPEGADLTGAYWIPVTRDLAAERRLLSTIEAMLNEAPVP